MPSQVLKQLLFLHPSPQPASPSARSSTKNSTARSPSARQSPAKHASEPGESLVKATSTSHSHLLNRQRTTWRLWKTAWW